MTKVFWLIVLWVVIIFALIILTAAMPAINSIVDISVESVEATSNTSNYPGFIPALQSAPIWLYLILPACGVIWTVILLKGGTGRG